MLMKQKMLLVRLGTAATMLALMSCCSALHGTQGSQSQPGYLTLIAGQLYTSKQPETWVSIQKYESLEQDLINAITANQQLRAAK